MLCAGRAWLEHGQFPVSRLSLSLLQSALLPHLARPAQPAHTEGVGPRPQLAAPHLFISHLLALSGTWHWALNQSNRTTVADLLISFLLMLAMMCFDTMIFVFGDGEMVGDISSDSGLVSCRHGESVEIVLSLRSPL